MSKTNNFIFIFLVIFLSGIWILLACFQKFNSQKYLLIKFTVPKDENKNNTYNSFFLLNQLKTKKKIQLELNSDHSTNLKKIELIRYEARKLNYTKDTSTVLDISLTNEVYYGELIKLIKICNDDNHKMFSLLKTRFIIFGEFPPESVDTIKKITPLYLL